MSSSKYINEDTYQTLQEVNIETQSDYEKAIEPLWKEDKDQYKKLKIINDVKRWLNLSKYLKNSLSSPYLLIWMPIEGE